MADLIGPPPPEQSLGAWAVTGVTRDDAELVALYDAEMDRLVAFICGSDRSVRFQDAEEVATDALTVARENWAQVRAEGNPAGFVFSVAQKRLTVFRRLRAAEGLDGLTGRRAPLGPSEDLVRALRLEEALERLTYRQRQIVLLRELLGFSIAETATILDLTDEKVVSEVGEDGARAVDRPAGRRAAGTSAAARAEEFAALARVLRRGPRRRALARRRFVTALQRGEALSAPLGFAPLPDVARLPDPPRYPDPLRVPSRSPDPGRSPDASRSPDPGPSRSPVRPTPSGPARGSLNGPPRVNGRPPVNGSLFSPVKGPPPVNRSRPTTGPVPADGPGRVDGRTTGPAPVDGPGRSASDRVVGLRAPSPLPRREAGAVFTDEIEPGRVEPKVAAVLRTSATYGSERDPAFLRRVLAGLRRL